MRSSPASRGKISSIASSRLLRRLDPAALRAAWWAGRAARAANAQLAANGGLGRVDLPDPPAVPDRAQSGMDFVLTRMGHRCLVQAHVRQAWFAARGQPRDVVIGVMNVPEFRAHAWLDGDPPEKQQGCAELLRHPAP